MSKLPKRAAAICHGTCNCNVCKTTTDNIRRVGDANVLRPFLEEANFRRFVASTKTLENHIDMNNLDKRTKEVIKYYQKLNGMEEGMEDSEVVLCRDDRPMTYAKLLADLHVKNTMGSQTKMGASKTASAPCA